MILIAICSARPKTFENQMKRLVFIICAGWLIPVAIALVGAINTLDDAYEAAHGLEFSEVNFLLLQP